MTCMCPACRGVNNASSDYSTEVTVEVTLAERMYIDVPQFHDDEEYINFIRDAVAEQYSNAKVIDWEVI